MAVAGGVDHVGDAAILLDLRLGGSAVHGVGELDSLVQEVAVMSEECFVLFVGNAHVTNSVLPWCGFGFLCLRTG